QSRRTTYHTTHPPPPRPHPLSLHDALPIWTQRPRLAAATVSSIHLRSQSPAPVVDSRQAHPGNAAATPLARAQRTPGSLPKAPIDRKSTRLNSSHLGISYAVFCLKKKTQPS